MKLTKLQETIIYILQHAKEKGISGLSKFQLMKFVYLIQVESYRFMGSPFIEEVRFMREKNGPISTNIYDAIKSLEGEYIHIDVVPNRAYGYDRHDHKLIKAPKTYALISEEKIFMNSVLDDYIQLSQAKLKELVYKTEPMQNIIEQEKHSGNKAGYSLDMNTVPLDPDVLEAMSSHE
jgi:uncharacterized phage-associated protein